MTRLLVRIGVVIVCAVAVIAAASWWLFGG